jgi:hypothetical protein
MSVDRETVEEFNALIAKLEIGLNNSGKHKNRTIYWTPPKKWVGRKPLFGYTPWKTEYKGKLAFYATVYRWSPKAKGWKLTKSVKCATRKRAKALSLKWFNGYYKET